MPNFMSLDLKLSWLWAGHCSPNGCWDVLAQPFLYDRALSLQSSRVHLCSPQTLHILFAWVAEQLCFCCGEGCEQLYPPLLWAQEPHFSPAWGHQSQPQWRWHQGRRRAGLQLCRSPALLSQAWPTGWHPGLASARSCPHGAQGWGCPWAVPKLSHSLAGLVRLCPASSWEPPLNPRELLNPTGTQMSRQHGRIHAYSF